MKKHNLSALLGFEIIVSAIMPDNRALLWGRDSTLVLLDLETSKLSGPVQVLEKTGVSKIHCSKAGKPRLIRMFGA